MICPKCNKENPEGIKVCQSCSAPLQQNIEQEQKKKSVSENTSQIKKIINTLKQDKKKRTMALCSAAAIILMFVLVIIFAVSHKNKIDLQEYTEVSFSGYDGYGKATVKFNEEKFVKDFLQKAGIDTDDLGDINSLPLLLDLLKENDGSDYSKALNILIKFQYDLDKKESLRNGDEVKVMYTFDNDAANELGIEFIGDSAPKKVSGLDKIKEINPFDGVDVQFDGMAPNASASVVINDSKNHMNESDFSISESQNLTVGDKVTVTLNIDEQDYIEQYGCKFSETSKEYTCVNVDSYITKAEDVDETSLDSMKKQTNDVILAYFAEHEQEIMCHDLKYVGYYFLCKKDKYDTSIWGPFNSFNQVYLIYSGKVKSKEKKFKESTVYFPVAYANLVKYKDGTVYVDTNSNKIEGETSLEYSYQGWLKDYVSGFTDQAKMKNDLVISELGNYEMSAVGLK